MGNTALFKLGRKRAYPGSTSSSLGLADCDTSDDATSTMAASVYDLNRFFAGNNLESIVDYMSRCDDDPDMTRSVYSDSLMETCYQLMGRQSSIEPKGVHSTGHGSHELWDLFFRIFRSIYMDQFEFAESQMRQFKGLTRKLILPRPIQKLVLFYEGLIAAVLASSQANCRHRRARLNVAQKILRKLQSDNKVEEEPSMWNKIYLLDAQLQVCRGHHETALLLFHKSVDIAELEGFSHEQGLAYELAGRMCQRYLRTVEADLYLSQARDFYGRWGASAKIEQLDQDVPVLMEVSIGSSSTNHSS